LLVRIPFTDVKIAVGLTAEGSRSRGFLTGRAAANPERDLSGFKVDAYSLFVAWRNNTDVYGCVREIYQNVGVGGHFFYDPKDPKRERPAPDGLIQRVEKVLGYQYGGMRGFKTRAFKQHLISGNCYIEKVQNLHGELLGLKVLDARTFSIVTDEHGVVYRYLQKPPVTEKGLEPVVFEPDEVIHWKHDEDPNAEAFGFSPTETVLWEVRGDLSAAISNYFFFENDAVPAAQYILDDNISDEQAQQAVEELKKQIKGTKNRHKAVVLKGVKEIKTIRLSQRDMEFLEGRKFTTDKVCAAFGVPKVILGYTEGVNYTNHQGQRKEFYEGTVRDYEQSFEELMNQEIIPAIEKGLEEKIAFGFKAASFDTEMELWDRAIRAREAGLLTINGARSVVGEDPIDEARHGDLGEQIILGSGNGAVLLTDIGIDPAVADPDMEELQKRIVHLDQRSRVRERS